MHEFHKFIFGVKLYMFRRVPLSIITSFFTVYTVRKLSANLYDIYHCCVYSEKLPDDWQRNCLRHVEFYSTNKFVKLVHLVGFIIRIYHDARSAERQNCLTCWLMLYAIQGQPTSLRPRPIIIIFNTGMRKEKAPCKMNWRPSVWDAWPAPCHSIPKRQLSALCYKFSHSTKLSHRTLWMAYFVAHVTVFIHLHTKHTWLLLVKHFLSFCLRASISYL